MAFYRMLIVDLIAGAILMTVISTFLDRTFLSAAIHNPVRSRVISLVLAWVIAVAVLILMSPWRYEVPLVYAIAAVPIGIIQVRRVRRAQQASLDRRQEPIRLEAQRKQLEERP